MKIQSIQSVVLVLAITMAFGVTFYVHYDAEAHQLDRLKAEARAWFAWARAEVDNGDPQNHNVGFTVTADASLYVCVDPLEVTLDKRITAEVVLQNGQKVLDTTNAVALLFLPGVPWQGKEAEAKVAHIPNFRVVKVWLHGCPDCGSSS